MKPSNASRSNDSFRLAGEIYLRFLSAEQHGAAPRFENLLAAHPDLGRDLRELHENHGLLARVAGAIHQASSVDGFVERVYGAEAVRHRSVCVQDPQETDELTPQPKPEPRLGGRFSSYEVRREVGRGGMGAVLEIWEPELRRRLAMKVVLGRGERELSDSPRLEPRTVGRFLEEAQITAQLDHPGIVPVHELGVDDHGRVYFTMRLVKGRTLGEIYELARGEREGWTQTRVLNVLLRVCEAVAFAHSKGVVHRDLKPANVMVGRFGEVYTMDWGLSHVMRTNATDSANETGENDRVSTARHDPNQASTGMPCEQTVEGDVLGTPCYMPPEQALGKLGATSPRCDVYACGAMLYQLLAGTPPYVADDERIPHHEMLERVRSGPPAPLSRVAPRSPAELVAICEHAMARDPSARYADMSELADDLRAFLERRVVSAYEAGAWAEAKKWVLRNRGLAVSIASAVAIFLIGFATTWTQYVRAEDKAVEAGVLAEEATEQARLAEANARRADDEARQAIAAREAERVERERAETRERQVRDVAEFQSSMLSQLDVAAMGATLIAELRTDLARQLELRTADPLERARLTQSLDELLPALNANNIARSLLVEHLLAKAATTIELRFSTEPQIEAELRNTLAHAYRWLGLGAQAREELEEVAEARIASESGMTAPVLTALNNLAVAMDELGDYATAEIYYRLVLGEREHTLGALHSQTLVSLNNLGMVLLGAGRLSEAEELLLSAWRTYESSVPTDDVAVSRAISNLGSLCMRQSRFADAADWFARALEHRRCALEPGHPDVLRSINNLAAALLRLRDHDAAEPLLAESLERSRQLFGDLDPRTLTAVNNLALLNAGRGKHEAAERLYREAEAGFRALRGPNDPATLGVTHNLCVTLLELREPEEAAAVARRAYEGRRAMLGPDAKDTLDSLNNLGIAEFESGRWSEAEALLLEAVERGSRARGRLEPATLVPLGRLVDVYIQTHRYESAEPWARELFERKRELEGPLDADTLRTLNNWAYVLAQSGRQREAASAYRTCWEAGRETLGEDHLDTLSAERALAVRMLECAQPDAAANLLEDALERAYRCVGKGAEMTVDLETQLGLLASARGEIEVARRRLTTAVADGRARLGAQHPVVFAAELSLAEHRICRESDFAGLDDLRDLVADVNARRGPEHPETMRARSSYGRALQSTGAFEAAGEELRAAYDGCVATLGVEHSLTRDAQQALAAWLVDAGRLADAERILAPLVRRLEPIRDQAEGEWANVRSTMVELQRRWDVAEPGKGHGESANEWQDR